MNFWTTARKATVNPTKWWGYWRASEAKTKSNYFIEFPVFEYTQIPQLDASYIVTEFRLTAPNPFSLPYNILPPNGVNFCLAVRWPQTDNDGLNVTRYKLWSNVGEKLYFPEYNGEVIPVNSVFEIWNVLNSGEVSNSVPFRISTSLLAEFGANRACCEGESNQLTLVQVCELFANQGLIDFDLPLVFNYCVNEDNPRPEDETGIITEDATGKISTEDETGVITEDQ